MRNKLDAWFDRLALRRRLFGEVFLAKANGRPFLVATKALCQRCLGLLRFGCFRFPIFATYRSYRPDSDFVFGRHPEFAKLLPKWSFANEVNNAGDLSRYYSLILNIKQVLAEGISGDFAELGVYRGNSAALLAHFAQTSERLVFLFDTFEGFDARDLRGHDAHRRREFAHTSLTAVQRLVGCDRSTRYVVGYFPASIPADLAERRFAFVHLDCDLYQPMRDALAFFHPRMTPGGMIVLHDYSSGSWLGAKRAVDEFCDAIAERPVLLPDKSGTAILRTCRNSK